MKSEIVWDSVDHITHEAVAQSATSIIEPGAVLMVVRSGILARTVPIALAGRSLALNQDLKALCPGPSIDSKFLYYLLESKMPELLSLVSRGATVHRLITDQIRDIEFRLPPLIEQRRIVTILDEAFEAIATTKANTERNRKNLLELRTAHLQATVGEPKPGWQPRKLGDLISIQNGYAFKSGDYGPKGHFVMRIGNVQEGEITLANPKFIELDGAGLDRFSLEEDDILVSLTGNIGRVGMIRSEHLPAVLNQRVARIKPKDRQLDRDFLFRYLSSRSFRESLSSAGHGAAQQNVSTKEIETISFFLPPFSAQRDIAERLGGVDVQFEALVGLLQRKQAALDELKQSLLHQAFSGQL